jgi:co-chaperonin GroES (HSP10)
MSSTYNNIKMHGWRILVKPDPVEEVYGESKIVIVHEDVKRERAKQEYGTVLAMGPMAFKGIKGYDYEIYGDWVKVGDRVLYAKYSGRFVMDPDNPEENLVALNDEDIILQIEEK